METGPLYMVRKARSYCRLLLTQAMEASQSPNDLGGINAYNLSAGEAGLNDVERFVVLIALEGGYNHSMIRNIEIGIGTWQALVFIQVFLWHGQFHHVELFAIQEAHLFQLAKILL
jgi:hypothetical protein